MASKPNDNSLDAATQATIQKAIAEVRAGNGAAAKALLDPLCRFDSSAPAPWFLMAQACRVADDDAGAAAALDRQLSQQPAHIGALLMRADIHDRLDERAGAERCFRRAVQLAQQQGGKLNPNLVPDIRKASAWLQMLERDRLSRIDEALGTAGLTLGERSPLVREMVAILKGEAQVQLQQPSKLYVPGLPQRAFYERDEFAWVPEVESFTDAVRAECLTLLNGRGGFEPYIPADYRGKAAQSPNAHLIGSENWSAFHLIRNGDIVEENASRCPETIRSLLNAPMPCVPGVAPMALFSLLKPNTHIKPHHGLFNHRLICHLPLIVPDGCEFRVGNHVRPWREGEMMLFDDSVLHEAWNRSDKLRVILLFEVWRPEISESDRLAISTVLEAAGINAED